MTPIILCTLNARYIHSSLGLRYLYANLQERQRQASILEFTIDARPSDIAEKLLQLQPTIIGFGIYIWNIEQTNHVVALLKRLRPDIKIVLGGPEVSYEIDQQPITAMADYVIPGYADLAFYQLCDKLLTDNPPATKIFKPADFNLSQLNFPYNYYSRQDIENRVIYVEASRGCPFKCEFCLSALDKTSWPFDMNLFLDEMLKLYERGARQFKFVDRTFNLKIDFTTRLLAFFLERMDDKMFLHFELIPDNLPDKLKSMVQKFPPGSLQFEIGIQTFNPEVQKIISRKQDNQKTIDNLNWLRQNSHVHLHSDLIAGLPGESIDSFGRGFNQLVALNPHEIQVGILKRLRGTPIIRHTESYEMVYNPNPPYNVLSTSHMDFSTLQNINRFARYWDMIANSGRFQQTLPIILGDDPFNRFMQFSNWLYNTTEQTHRIALARLFGLIYQGLTKNLGADDNVVKTALERDYMQSGLKGMLSLLPANTDDSSFAAERSQSSLKPNKRQNRHLH